MSLTFAGKEVKLWNDTLWRKLRVRDGLSDNFLADPAYVGEMKPGGGKGGDLMAFTVDQGYIIKELGKGDHVCLLDVTESYVQRVIGGHSLVVTIYLHFTDVAQEKNFFVMRNILTHKGPWAGLYDLKGCDDDKTMESNGRRVKAVHKRIWHLHMWCGNCAWTDDRMTYYEGKVAARNVAIQMTKEQKAAVVSRIKQDTDWLAKNNLMDYSLLVGVKRLTAAEFASDSVASHASTAHGGAFRQPMVFRATPDNPGPDGKGSGDVMLVYIGIIDFLQAWTMGKKIAMALKTFERNKATVPPDFYAQRFYQHFERAFTGTAVPLDLPGQAKLGEINIDLSGPSSQDDEQGEEVGAFHSCRSIDTRAAADRKKKVSFLARPDKGGCSRCLAFVLR